MTLSETELPIYADPGLELALVTGSIDDAYKRGELTARGVSGGKAGGGI